MKNTNSNALARRLASILFLIVCCGVVAASAQGAKKDEQILRDLISRADQNPAVIKYTDDSIFVSGAFPRPIVGRQQMDAMKPKRDATINQRMNQVQKTEAVRLVISKSKDMAYEFGNFTLSFDTPDKKHVNFDGSYLRVWRKIKGEWMSEAFFARPNDDADTTAETK